jgi:pimeloyl-ACP methyl ester carboxylesterase
MVAILAGAMDSNVAGIVACNCPAHLADFMLTRFRRLLFSTMKIVGTLVSFRVSVNHFYSYGQLIRDESWVKTFESDPLIADARRLSMPTYQSLLEGWDGTTAVARVRKPLLILQGRHDEMQPPDQSEILFAAANEPKDYHLLETGHLPHLEDTRALCELLIDWMGPDGRAT